MNLVKIFRLPKQVGDELDKLNIGVGGVAVKTIPGLDKALLDNQLYQIHRILVNKGWCPETVKCDNVALSKGLDLATIDTLSRLLDIEDEIENLKELSLILNSSKYTTYRINRYEVYENYTYIEVVFL